MKNLISLPRVLCLCTTLLSGCASMNSSFDCPMKPGVMCKSLDNVNSMVDQGQLGKEKEIDCKDCNTNKTNNTSANHLKDFNTPFPEKIGIQPGDPLRYSESVLQIWIAPFEDEQGNYHQESDVFTVVKGGHWVGAPVKALNSDDV
jgi:conjugal transfer pilus assembly protein TraV